MRGGVGLRAAELLTPLSGTNHPARRLNQQRSGQSHEEGKMSSPTDPHDPCHHTRKMRQRLNETIGHLRQDIDKVDDPQFKAMFETSAEVLGGLVKAFQDYEQKNEGAWRSQPVRPSSEMRR
jgi:hypothetical protein